jgi:hypothetical protein
VDARSNSSPARYRCLFDSGCDGDTSNLWYDVILRPRKECEEESGAGAVADCGRDTSRFDAAGFGRHALVVVRKVMAARVILSVWTNIIGITWEKRLFTISIPVAAEILVHTLVSSDDIYEAKIAINATARVVVYCAAVEY